MAEFFTSGLTADQVSAMIQAAMAALPTSYVNGGGAMLVSDLLANYPASSAYQGLYARVSDLYNNGVLGQGVNEILRCRYDATNNIYRWQPQRADFNTAIASTGGSMTITPLVTPPTVRLTGGLVTNINIGTSTLNAYVGQKQRIIQNSGNLGVLVTTLTGLIGSNLTLLAGSTTDIEYGPSGWFKSA